MTSEEIISQVRTVFSSAWSTREGKKVPDTDSLTLGNDALTIDATVLYADMAESTALVDGYKPWFAAEIYKSYLLGACRVIQSRGGDITAFDGDRVMAIFTGTSKNSTAARAALHINFLVGQLNKLIQDKYPSSGYTLGHAIGIDTSELFVAKTGIRASNDLVWVGRAANYAAKLSALNEAGYPIFITEAVYSKLNEGSKFGGNPRQDMWEKRMWTAQGIPIYRTSWTWGF